MADATARLVNDHMDMLQLYETTATAEAGAALGTVVFLCILAFMCLYAKVRRERAKRAHCAIAQRGSDRDDEHKEGAYRSDTDSDEEGKRATPYK